MSHGHGLQTRNVTKRFGGHAGIVAVRDMSFDVKPGEFISIIGPSGCGKSTLFNIIGGFLKDYEGEVVLDAGQSDDAQASEALEATLDGDPITVAFNPQYLLDGLGALSTEYVQFGFLQETKPVEFVGIDKPGGTVAAEFRYLLVPIRITS